MVRKNQPSVNRRSLMKTIGAATVGLSGIPTASAKRNVVKQFKKALEKRRKHDWDLDKWYRYVDKLGVQYGNSQADVPDVSQDIISGFEPADLTLTMTYYLLSAHYPYPDYDQIELHWQFDNSGADDAYTGKPKDLAKIGFSPDSFSKPEELDGDSWYEFGPSTSSPGINAVSDGGIVGEWNGYYYDASGVPITDGETGGDMGLEDHISVYVDPSNSQAYDQLTIYFAYSMLYDSARFDGVGFSTDGVIGYQISDEQDSWTVNPAYEAADLYDGKEYTP